MKTTAHLTLPQSLGTLTGYDDGRIDRSAPTGVVVQHYHFSDAGVQWLVATPDANRLVAGHTNGFAVVFETQSGKEIRESSALLQSEYCPIEAETTGELSIDGRWLYLTIRRNEVDIGWLIDMAQQHRPHRQVGPPGSKPGRPAQWS